MLRVEYILLTLLVSVVVLPSCRKSDRDYDSSIKASTDEVQLQDFMADIIRVIDDAAKVEFGITSQYYTDHFTCASVTANLAASPATLSIDYGSSDCLGPDDRARNGRLDLTMSGTYLDSGNTITITPVDFDIGGYVITGVITIKNRGKNGNGNTNWKITTSDLEITYPDGESLATWNANLTRTLISDNATDNIMDDLYEVTGTTSGRSHSGNTFSSEVITALQLDMGCTHIPEGEISLIPDNLHERLIDFGEGTCDTTVVVTIGGIEYVIGLN